MLECCRDHGLLPVVTFHHFSSPRWVAAAGGWANPATAERFARFCERAAEHFGALIGIACTINEPNIVALLGYGDGNFPPGKRDESDRKAATDVFVDAHRLASEVIKSSSSTAPVGLTLAMSDYQSVDGGEERLEAERSLMEDVFLDAGGGDDFVGVQTYTRLRIGPAGPLGPEEGVATTLMGYEFWPDALAATVRRAHAVTNGSPILVTENGVAVDDDKRRIDFVETALAGLADCLRGGIDVRGYFYWSAFDNFEWAYGYAPTFGLIDVDRTTQQRTPKPSAYWLGEIARAGGPPSK
jgi:beta-glucosidase